MGFLRHKCINSNEKLCAFASKLRSSSRRRGVEKKERKYLAFACLLQSKQQIKLHEISLKTISSKLRSIICSFCRYLIHFGQLPALANFRKQSFRKRFGPQLFCAHPNQMETKNILNKSGYWFSNVTSTFRTTIPIHFQSTLSATPNSPNSQRVSHFLRPHRVCRVNDGPKWVSTLPTQNSLSLARSACHVCRSHCGYYCYYVLWNQINAPHDCWIKIERTWYTFEDCPSAHAKRLIFNKTLNFMRCHTNAHSQHFQTFWFCVLSINHRAEIIIILGRLSFVFILSSVFYCFTRDDPKRTCMHSHSYMKYNCSVIAIKSYNK